MFDLAKHLLILGADPPSPQLDAVQYWYQGGRLAAGDWLLRDESAAYQTPGYPLFLAPMRALLGPFALLGTLLAQHLCVIATSLVTAATCGRISGRNGCALLAYVLSMLCYSRAWHANLVYTETLFTLFLTCVVAALVGYLRRPSAARVMFLGALVGAATLVRPIGTYLWFPLALSIVTIGFGWNGVRRAGVAVQMPSWPRIAGHVALLVAATYLVLAPWLVRNQVLFGRAFMTSFLGRNLWVVTFQGESGAGLTLADGPASRELKRRLAAVDVPVTLHDTWSVSRALAAGGMADDHIDRLMMQSCLESMGPAWRKVAYQALRRTVNYWRCISNPFPFYNWSADRPSDLGQRVWNSPTSTAAYRYLNRYAFSRSLRLNELVIVAVAIGAAGLLRCSTTRALAVGLVLILLYFNAVTAALEIPGYRYRMILEPIMIICFVCGTEALVGRFTGTLPARHVRDEPLGSAPDAVEEVPPA